MNRGLVAVALGAAALLQAYVIYYLLTYGGLVGLSQWDDCAFLLRGFENLDQLAKASSWGDLLMRARSLDFHAPISDMQAMLGLVVTGGALWGPYALSVVNLAVVIMAIASVAAMRNRLLLIAGMLFLLVQPITVATLASIKSDWAGGLFMAAAVFVLFDAAETDAPRQKVLGAALLGLALITKMTAFYLTVPMLGAFFAFELYGAIIHRDDTAASSALQGAWRSVLARARMNWRLYALCAALVLVPYIFFFYYSREALIGYVRYALQPLWGDGYTTSQRLAFYLPFGFEGRWAWGALHVALAVLFLGAVATAAVKRAYVQILACVGVLLIAAILLTPLVVGKTSNITFGAPFLGVLIGAALIFMHIIVGHAPRLGGVAVLLVVLALAPFNPLKLKPPLDEHMKPVTRAESGALQALYTDVTRRISDTRTKARPKVVLTYEQFLAPFPNISILFHQRTGEFLSVERIDDLRDAQSGRLRSEADYMLTVTPAPGARTVPNLAPNMPVSADPAAADAWVRESGRFQLIRSYPIKDAVVHLYGAAPGHGLGAP